MGRKSRREERIARREQRRQDRQSRDGARQIIMDFTDEAEEELGAGSSVDDILETVIEKLKEKFQDRRILLVLLDMAEVLVPLLLAR